MSDFNPTEIHSALRDFEHARNRAMMKEIIARFTGESTELLSYEEVRQKLRVQGGSDRGLKEIPLEAIVGSVGRYNDFTRDFLPRKDSIQERWARVKAATVGMTGLPPIDVYRIGDAYFVKDGNHRVSVAREAGVKYIQAYVTEVTTKVPLSPEDSPDDLILKNEYVNFLDHTHLDELRPGADLSVSVPGQYDILEEHISVHRYFMGIDQKREIRFEEAVAHWYDTIYLPVVQAIRERGILHFFPGRTEADMYLWIAEHRATLEKELGWQIRTESAINDLTRRYGGSLGNFLNRAMIKIVDSLTGGKLVPGPPAGIWRQEMILPAKNPRLFKDILVPVGFEDSSWCALEQALVIAQREGSVLHGLHVVEDEEIIPSAKKIRKRFQQRCSETGTQGDLVITVGDVARTICERARFTDIVVTNLAYPPGPGPFDRLESGFHDLIQHSPRPILATPNTVSSFSKALLAYDGSPKADEALFIATYLSAKWDIPLVVVAVNQKKFQASRLLARTEKYLHAHGIQATYVEKNGSPAEIILRTSGEQQCDLLLMGGYGSPPILEVFKGSVVDQVLRQSETPVFICR